MIATSRLEGPGQQPALTNVASRPRSSATGAPGFRMVRLQGTLLACTEASARDTSRRAPGRHVFPCYLSAGSLYVPAADGFQIISTSGYGVQMEAVTGAGPTTTTVRGEILSEHGAVRRDDSGVLAR